jgi:hypothetical protein
VQALTQVNAEQTSKARCAGRPDCISEQTSGLLLLTLTRHQSPSRPAEFRQRAHHVTAPSVQGRPSVFPRWSGRRLSTTAVLIEPWDKSRFFTARATRFRHPDCLTDRSPFACRWHGCQHAGRSATPSFSPLSGVVAGLASFGDIAACRGFGVEALGAQGKRRKRGELHVERVPRAT